jgi:hypothetical protein
VTELKESALRDVGKVPRRRRARIEHGVDGSAGTGRGRAVDGVGEVEVLHATVFEKITRQVRAADRSARRVRRGSAVGLVRVPVVRERPVDVLRLSHDLPQHALGDTDLRAGSGGDRALRIDEVVHERRQLVVVRELADHRRGGVEDDEHVGRRASIGLEKLAVVGERARRSGQEKEQRRDARALPPHESGEIPRAEPGPGGAQKGNLAGYGPTSRSATRLFEYWRNASFSPPVVRISNPYINWSLCPPSFFLPARAGRRPIKLGA